MTAVGFLPIWPALIIAGLAWWGFSIVERRRLLQEAKARAATYANCIGPVIIASLSPNETLNEIEARAQEWREIKKTEMKNTEIKPGQGVCLWVLISAGFWGVAVLVAYFFA